MTKPPAPPSEPETHETRRTEGVRSGGRSARVVESVLQATAEELGRVGYAALRVEDVAGRSGVNKTTIYRRWPTKVDLVAAAIKQVSTPPEMPDKGTLRDDLLQAGRHMMAKSRSPLGSGLIRMMQMERGHPDLDGLIRKLRAEQLRTRAQIVERGIARGEVPASTDASLVAELTMSPIMSRLIHTGIPVDEAFVESVVDTVLAGARAGALRRG